MYMETIDDDCGVRHVFFDGLPVRLPHIHRHPLDLVLVGERAEIRHQIGQAAIGDKIEDRAFVDVREHAAILADDLEFIDAEHFRRFELDRGAEMFDVVAEDVAHRFLVEADCFCDRQEGPAKTLGRDELDQSPRGEALVIQIRDWLEQCA